MGIEAAPTKKHIIYEISRSDLPRPTQSEENIFPMTSLIPHLQAEVLYVRETKSLDYLSTHSFASESCNENCLEK